MKSVKVTAINEPTLLAALWTGDPSDLPAEFDHEKVADAIKNRNQGGIFVVIDNNSEVSSVYGSSGPVMIGDWVLIGVTGHYFCVSAQAFAAVYKIKEAPSAEKKVDATDPLAVDAAGSASADAAIEPGRGQLYPQGYPSFLRNIAPTNIAPTTWGFIEVENGEFAVIGYVNGIWRCSAGIMAVRPGSVITKCGSVYILDQAHKASGSPPLIPNRDSKMYAELKATFAL